MFQVIDKKEYAEIEKLVNSGEYIIESEMYG